MSRFGGSDPLQPSRSYLTRPVSTTPRNWAKARRREDAAPSPRSMRTVQQMQVSNAIPPNAVDASCPVQTYHAAQTIDLAAVFSKVFPAQGIHKVMKKRCVIIELGPADNTKSKSPTPPNAPTSEPTRVEEAPSLSRFVVVFRFGSVVFFNVSTKDMASMLRKIKKCAKQPIASDFEGKENYCVHVQSKMEAADEETAVTGDYCIVQELNMESADVISSVLAQSVAIETYNHSVEGLLSNFAEINGIVQSTGDLSDIKRDRLFQAVAQNNSIFIDMVSKLGLKSRSETAWNLSQYEHIHEGMREEFEISSRFQNIEFKLNLIQQNAKFFLEVMANQKSNSLEWIIIVLILFECILMIMEMSGLGEQFFGTVANMMGLVPSASTMVAASPVQLPDALPSELQPSFPSQALAKVQPRTSAQ